MDKIDNLYEKGRIYCHGSKSITIERLQEVFGCDVFEIEQNYNEAFSLFTESAENGNPNAQYCLGCCYNRDWVVIKTKNYQYLGMSKLQKMETSQQRGEYIM